MHSIKWAKILVHGLLLLTAFGCASARKAGDESGSAAKTQLGVSSLEINYIRGNNRHRFIAVSTASNVHAECYRDRQLLKARNVDPAKYHELLKQASELVNGLQSPAAVTSSAKPPGECRTPFTLKLKNDATVKELDGCRSTDQGVIVGKLIQDAEFLVFSNN